MNEAMPSLDAAQAASLVPDTQLILLADTGADVDAARHALLKSGFDYAIRVAREFGAPDRSFWVVIGQLSRVAEFSPSRPHGRGTVARYDSRNAFVSG